MNEYIKDLFGLQTSCVLSEFIQTMFNNQTNNKEGEFPFLSSVCFVQYRLFNPLKFVFVNNLTRFQINRK